MPPPLPLLPETLADRIRIKRVYRAPRVSDGARVLVDRLWPRGLAKDRARLHSWCRDIAPSDALRRWYHADATRWPEFVDRYRDELSARADLVHALAALTREGAVTLLFSSKEEKQNNAAVLRDYLRQYIDAAP